MFRFSLSTRRLPQRLSAVTLSSTARSKMVSEPNDFISAMNCRERSILATSSSASRLAPKLNDILTQKRNLLTDPGGTESKDEARKKENRKAYRNRHGEEMTFSPRDPPPGYVFVPSDNHFITRNCRKLTQKLYVVYRPQSRRKLAGPMGLNVPRNIFQKVESDFQKKTARNCQSLWQALDKKYSQIPPVDKNELHRLIFSRHPTLTGKSALDRSEITIYAYVRDRYMPFKSLDLYSDRDTKAIARAHQKAEKILASWRGEKVSTDHHDVSNFTAGCRASGGPRDG